MGSPEHSHGEGPHAPTGNFTGPVLFILAEFSDRAGTYGESTWGNFVSNNIADYFSEASYGKANLVPATETSGVNNNGVIGWVNLGYPHPNTANSTGTANQVITRNAIIAADPFIDYASYDTDGNNVLSSEELAIVIVVAGFERAYSANYTPSVWGTSGESDFAGGAPTVDGVSVGGFSGVMPSSGKFIKATPVTSTRQPWASWFTNWANLIFGLPDLYDTDGSSSGIGAFGVMGEAAGAGPTVNLILENPLFSLPPGQN